MKRIGLVLTSLCVVSFLTGCGGKEKSLECVNNLNESGVDSRQVFTINFDKKDKYSSATLNQEYTLSQEVLKTMDLATFKRSIENSVLKTTFKDMKYDIKDNGKDTITFNINISEKDMETMSGSKNISGSDDAKKAFEKAGYTCKVK